MGDLTSAVGEGLLWGVAGAVISLGTVVSMANTHDRRVGLMGAMVVPLIFAPVNVVVGIGAHYFLPNLAFSLRFCGCLGVNTAVSLFLFF